MQASGQVADGTRRSPGKHKGNQTRLSPPRTNIRVQIPSPGGAGRSRSRSPSPARVRERGMVSRLDVVVLVRYFIYVYCVAMLSDGVRLPVMFTFFYQRKMLRNVSLQRQSVVPCVYWHFKCVHVLIQNYFYSVPMLVVCPYFNTKLFLFFVHACGMSYPGQINRVVYCIEESVGHCDVYGYSGVT